MTQILASTIELIDDFSLTVIGDRKKIIFWDTCALLDIIRFPRDNNSASLASLIKIHKEIVNDRVYSVASEITIKEFNDHESSTITESKEIIKKNSEQYESIMEIVNFFTSSQTGYSHINTVSYNIERYLINIVDEIIQKTVFIQKDEIATVWLDRIVQKKTPLRRKGEYKDAAIWSTCISLADKIDAASELENVIFFSSNVNDYYQAGTTNFSHDILTECTSYNIAFAINFDVVFLNL
ncbi:PIN domain-containing protein [Microbacter margulisiae]|uniref:DUF4935 domain-containing protein n=1 Tax=Microbacter margulisiae TaxID=1350067 RepID=A0A7W5DPB5_9PORP|nr:PIN domain-containing protein [Microbacter margulisiae]MBB3186099.1 hypothetical protein [Microbacter margulisiae]